MAVDAAFQQALPDYDITTELGRGAMGIVYMGRHRALDRKVAIKRLPSSFANDSAVRERFLIEARVVASLDHPHVVVIHDFVERAGQLALVMEHLPNGTVWDQFVHHGLAAPKACGLVLATLAGAQHAHERGVMHRDIKPENLIFTHDWQVKVTDFGIAQVLTGSETMSTLEGAIVGTPAYMSPEQAEGKPCGPAADVYASAAMLYEMLSGTLPFPDGESAMAIAKARLTVDPIPLRSVAESVPGALNEAIMHGLARYETDRFGSAEEFGVAIAEAAASEWGPHWMSQAGTTVQGSAAIEEAARTTTGSRRKQIDHAEASGSPAESLDADSHAVADEFTPGSSHDRNLTSMALAGMTPVQPQQSVRSPGADLNQLTPADIVNMAKVRRPGSPMAPLILAAILTVAAIALAFLGRGDDPASVGADSVIIDGAAVVGDEPIELDFTEVADINLDVESLDATLLGVPIGSVDVVNGVLDPSYLRWTAAGVVELSDGADPETKFPVRASNSVFLTAPFIVSAVLLLGGLASVQSNMRGLRGRRMRVGPYIGLAISGAVAGAAAAVLGMLMLETPMTPSSVLGTAVLGALAAVAAGEGYRRWRRRRRLKRASIAAARALA